MLSYQGYRMLTNEYHPNKAICIKTSPLSQLPEIAGNTNITILKNEPLIILEERTDWLLVKRGNDSGWMRREQLYLFFK